MRKVIKLFDDYSRIVSEGKCKAKNGEILKNINFLTNASKQKITNSFCK